MTISTGKLEPLRYTPTLIGAICILAAIFYILHGAGALPFFGDYRIYALHRLGHGLSGWVIVLLVPLGLMLTIAQAILLRQRRNLFSDAFAPFALCMLGCGMMFCATQSLSPREVVFHHTLTTPNHTYQLESTQWYRVRVGEVATVRLWQCRYDLPWLCQLVHSEQTRLDQYPDEEPTTAWAQSSAQLRFNTANDTVTVMVNDDLLFTYTDTP